MPPPGGYDPIGDLLKQAAEIRASRPPDPPMTMFTRALTTPLEAYARHLEQLASLMGWRIAEHGWIEAMRNSETTDECDAVEHKGVLFVSPRVSARMKKGKPIRKCGSNFPRHFASSLCCSPT